MLFDKCKFTPPKRQYGTHTGTSTNNRPKKRVRNRAHRQKSGAGETSRERMSGGQSEITESCEFNAALCRLLASASENDVDPRGSWVYRSSEADSDFEVIVYELKE